MVAGLRFRAEQYCQSSPAQSSSATADFGFSYVSAYGTNGLSQSYAGPTATGQSYGTGVAVDSSQKAYTLVQANADVGCGRLPGLLPRLAARPSGGTEKRIAASQDPAGGASRGRKYALASMIPAGVREILGNRRDRRRR